MSTKPFRNSKGVNKPFRSPFHTTPQNKNPNTPESSNRETSLRVSVSKRLAFQQTPPAKRICLNERNNVNENNEENKNNGPQESKKLTQQDLILLKKRIKEKQESINNIKTTLLYRKKNKAEDLEEAIQKWTSACQEALKDYQNHLQTAKAQSVSIAEILASFGIDSDIVNFSVSDDTFH